MPPIIDVPNLNRRVHRVSVDFYHQLGALGLVKKQTELIRGVIINKMSKSPLHGITARRLFQLLMKFLSPGFVVRFDEPLTLQDSEPEPDIAIVRGSDAEFASAHPTTAELVIEIAVTSLADDREMASIYAEAGVKEFWIVIAQKQQIEVHAQPENGHYLHERLYNTDEIIQCSSLPQIKLRVGDLFSELSA